MRLFFCLCLNLVMIHIYKSTTKINREYGEWSTCDLTVWRRFWCRWETRHENQVVKRRPSEKSKSASGNTIRKDPVNILGINISTISDSLKKISELEKLDKCLPHENSGICVCCCIWEIGTIYFWILTKVMYSFQILSFTKRRLRGPYTGPTLA